MLSAVEAASKDLKGERIMSAAGYEKSARDTLWRVVGILQPDRAPLDKLLDGLKKLDGLIADEKEVIEKTTNIDDEKRGKIENMVMNDKRVVALEEQLSEMERRLERASAKEQVRLALSLDRTQRRLASAIEKAQERLGVDTPEMSDLRRAERAQRDQAELVDKADFLRQELSELAPEAAGRLEESLSPMQEARAALGTTASAREKREAALPPENAALAKLEEARRELIEEIENAQFVEEVPEDKLEHLKELLEKLQELTEEEEKIQAESAFMGAAP